MSGRASKTLWLWSGRLYTLKDFRSVFRKFLITSTLQHRVRATTVCGAEWLPPPVPGVASVFLCPRSRRSMQVPL